VDVEAKYAEHYSLQSDGTYSKGESYGENETIKIETLENIEISMTEVFENLTVTD
jgi:hypothetical protein